MNYPEETSGTVIDSYEHRVIEMISRPEVGAQAQFQNKKKPKKYNYDPTLSPSLQWAGKDEHSEFTVPTLPLFVHERLSTKAIIKTLTDHKLEEDTGSLFGDTHHSLANQLKSYEHKDKWSNRMILGDSLVIMNSLLEYESMAGKVQMIYMDPPYGVKYNSNFQPFVRTKEVKHGEDDSFSREPEMVQAYRDTWELGIHSYLTYLRDRFTLARELLTESGSIFVQISDENVHHVREVLDEVFGAENFVSMIPFNTTTAFTTKTLSNIYDILLWYKKSEKVKFNKLFKKKEISDNDLSSYNFIELSNGETRSLTKEEKEDLGKLPSDGKLFTKSDLQSQGAASEDQAFEFEGKKYSPTSGNHWKANYPDGMYRLLKNNRITLVGNTLRYKRYFDDFQFSPITNNWSEQLSEQNKQYVVQTNIKVIQRCILMCISQDII